MRAVVICSGGLDSSTLAHHYRGKVGPGDLLLCCFNYGQRHAREVIAARELAIKLGARWALVDVRGWGELVGSALTDPEAEVPHGHYADETMRATVVPNRNAVMLSMAWGLAVDRGAEVVAYGAHAGDHPIYPDCRPEFVKALNTALRLATAGYRHDKLRIEAPFIKWTKTDIARRAAQLRVNIGATWSCYEGGELHCGRCGTCVERREALHEAGVPDPTVYACDAA